MTNTTNETSNAELLAKLDALLRQNTTLNPPAAPAFTTWPQSPPGAMAQPPQFFGAPAVSPVGLLVAINIPMPDGELAGYVQLPPTALANPQQAIAQLQAQGWPLRIWGRNPGNYYAGRRPFSSGGHWR